MSCCRAATIPAAKTKDPTPMSMSDVPKLSVFAKRLGNTAGKSTARMLVQVMIIMAPRYVVMNGLTGKGSRSFAVASCLDSVGWPFASDLAGGFGVSTALVGDCRRVATVGRMSKPFRTCGAEEYAVVAKRIAQQCSRKSVKAAGKVYGLKKLCRTCKIDHKSAAAWNR